MDERRHFVIDVLIALLGFGAFFLGFLYFTGNLTDGPRIFDDNQIFRLQKDLRERGIAGTIGDEIRTRLSSYKRFCPAFNIHKVLQAYCFKTNVFAWSVYAGILSAVTSVLLFVFARQLQLSRLAAATFGLATLFGQQSVISWKLIHGELLGMFFLALSLNFMARSAAAVRRGWLLETLFVVSALLAAMSKESFLLVLPALAYWRGWLQLESGGWLRKIIPSAVVLIVTSVGSVFAIKYGLGTTTFHYTGWIQGLPSDVFWSRFRLATWQFLHAADAYVLAVLLLLTIVLLVKGNESSSSSRSELQRPTWRRMGILVGLVLLLVTPQLLLYLSSGFSMPGDFLVYRERFLVPAMIAPSFATALLVDWVRSPRHANLPMQGARRIVWLLVIGLLIVMLGSRFRTAHRAATSYAKQSIGIETWLADIERHTNREDPILIVYPNKGPRAAVRVHYMLTELLGRRNLYYQTHPPKKLPNWESGTLEIEKQFSTMQSHQQLEDKSKLQAVLLIGHTHGRVAQTRFLESWNQHYVQSVTRDWFDPTQFKRRPYDFGHLSYFRKTL